MKRVLVSSVVSLLLATTPLKPSRPHPVACCARLSSRTGSVEGALQLLEKNPCRDSLEQLDAPPAGTVRVVHMIPPSIACAPDVFKA